MLIRYSLNAAANIESFFYSIKRFLVFLYLPPYSTVESYYTGVCYTVKGLLHRRDVFENASGFTFVCNLLRVFASSSFKIEKRAFYRNKNNSHLDTHYFLLYI